MVSAFLLFPLFSACQEEYGSSIIEAGAVAEDGPALEEKASAKSTTSTSSTDGVGEIPGTADGEEVTSAFATLVSALTDLPDGMVDDLERRMASRSQSRQAEDQRIHSAGVGVAAALTGSCERSLVQGDFTNLVTLERTSLQKEREAVSELLEVMGSEGRKQLWKAEGFADAMTEFQTGTATRNHQPFPGWLAGSSRSSGRATMGAEKESEKEVAAREAEETRLSRTVLALNFTSERARLDGQAESTGTEVAISSLSPEAAETPAAAAAALQFVDDTLLAGQSARFDALLVACPSLGDKNWLTLLSNGSITAYIGHVGGINHKGKSASTGAVADKSKSGGTGGGMGQGGMSQGGMGQGQGGMSQGQGGMSQGQGGMSQGQGGMSQTGMGAGATGQTGMGQGQGGMGQGTGGQTGMGQGQGASTMGKTQGQGGMGTGGTGQTGQGGMGAGGMGQGGAGQGQGGAGQGQGGAGQGQGGKTQGQGGAGQGQGGAGQGQGGMQGGKTQGQGGAAPVGGGGAG